MFSSARNLLLFLFLCIISVSILQCGQNTEENNQNQSQGTKTYKNLATDVKYVGMLKCRQCHYDKYETFIQTGMGKSFDRATKQKSSAKFDAHAVVYDKLSDLYYHPFWQGDTLRVKEFRLEGKDTVYKRTERIDYIVGSGQHTNSHIYSTNGYLHQIPVTFYTQKGKWDLPPGFENGNNSRFSRIIGLECMSCHNSYPEFVEGSENKFSSVPNGISCERCHGPGEIHVKEKEAGMLVDTSKEIDYSIVNPAKLPVNLQFDVCQRCHLQGNAVLKEGKSFYDFRPGMKLSDVVTVFLPKYANSEEDFIMASHADRLKQSQCFIQSEKSQVKNQKENTLKPYKDALTCVTCHNPHISVRVTGQEVFNTACKSCHGVKIKTLCSEKQEVRNQVQDNCVSCHMPKSGSIDIPHVRITDHFIRKPVKKENIGEIKKFLGLFAINEKTPDSSVIAEAYLNQFEKFTSSPAFLDSAKRYLPDRNDTEIEKNFRLLVRLNFLKDDYGQILKYVQRTGEQKLLQQVLTHSSYDNKDAWTCYQVGESFYGAGDLNRSYLFYKNASDLAPYRPDFLNKLAGNLIGLHDLNGAKNIYEKILAEDPEFAPAWCNLGFIYLQNRNPDKAREYYGKALALDPDYEQALMNEAGLLIYEKKNTEALSFIKRILKKNPQNEQALALQRRLKQ